MSEPANALSNRNVIVQMFERFTHIFGNTYIETVFGYEHKLQRLQTMAHHWNPTAVNPE